MNCKYVDEYTGICCNGRCPACADICPVPDRVDMCLYQENKEETNMKIDDTPEVEKIIVVYEDGTTEDWAKLGTFDSGDIEAFL